MLLLCVTHSSKGVNWLVTMSFFSLFFPSCMLDLTCKIFVMRIYLLCRCHLRFINSKLSQVEKSKSILLFDFLSIEENEEVIHEIFFIDERKFFFMIN